MTWIKICGITNLEDALTAVDAGADALGFVFYDKSPRHIGQEAARKIVEELPSNVEKVGVFVNQFADSICTLADEVGLTAVQLHGSNEDPHLADLVVKHRPDLKVVVGISMLQPQPEGWAMLWRPDVVHAFLVDSGTPSKLGGTGETFDWRMRRTSIAVIATLGRVVIAGGLSPTNVSEAIQILKPWGVDVASGVEAKQGKKDPKQVQAFVAAVRQAGKN